jgi:branched-chain amino acid transport system permease protein
MEQFIQQVINGITIGSVYAIIALGYTMVYGIIRLINFAHGAVFMIGAYLGYSLLLLMGGENPVGGPFLAIVVILAIPAVACGFLGFAMDRGVYRYLRAWRAQALVPLIAALGISLSLETAAMLTYGKEFKVYPQFIASGGFTFGSVVVSYFQIVLIAVCIGMMAALHLFVQYSRVGKAMRASALDHDAARLVGVNVDRIIMLVFVIGSALAAVAGVLFAYYYGSINFRMGYTPGLKAFSAAVLGGVGNIPGAMLGGFIIGLLETFGAGYISGAWKDLIAFVLLILIIVIKPTGLLGERIAERT